jgi:hypothetical protein
VLRGCTRSVDRRELFRGFEVPRFLSRSEWMLWVFNYDWSVVAGLDERVAMQKVSGMV